MQIRLHEAVKNLLEIELVELDVDSSIRHEKTLLEFPEMLAKESFQRKDTGRSQHDCHLQLNEPSGLPKIKAHTYPSKRVDSRLPIKNPKQNLQSVQKSLDTLICRTDSDIYLDRLCKIISVF